MIYKIFILGFFFLVAPCCLLLATVNDQMLEEKKRKPCLAEERKLVGLNEVLKVG